MNDRSLTAGVISERLNERVLAVAKMLVPTGKEESGKWVFGNSNGNAGESASLNLSGPYVGKWRDWASDVDRGDLLDLWASTRGMTLASAIKDAKKFLGIVDPLSVEPKKYPFPQPAKNQKELSPEGAALKWFREERCLLPETVSKFKVAADEHRRLMFPSYTPEGVLVNRFYRSLDKKQISQEKGCAPSLFGWQALTPDDLKMRSVVLCEGQLDAMTWTQWGFPALSVPNGAKNLNWIDYDWDNLEMFDSIYVSFDMDEDGEKGADLVMERLGLDRCLRVALPNKDANDCLRAGQNANAATKWISSAKPKQVKGFRSATDYAQKVKDRFFRPEITELDFAPSILIGRGGRVIFRGGEVTAWTGHSGHGKTTLLSFLAIADIGARGSTYFVASMEMLPDKLIHGMYLATKQAYPEDPALVDEFVDVLRHKLYFADRVGSISEADLFEMMLYCRRRCGMKAAVIDSFMCVEDLEENYPGQGAFLARLNTFSKLHDVHIHIVCHPRKGDEAFAPNTTDLKGASIIGNRVDKVLVVQRNMKKLQAIDDGEPTEKLNLMCDTTVLCRKDRETGWRGKVELFYNAKFRTFTKFSKSESAAKIAEEDVAANI